MIFLTTDALSCATDWVPNTPRRTVSCVAFCFCITLITSLSTCRKSPVLTPTVFVIAKVVWVGAVPIPADIVVVNPTNIGDKLPDIFSAARELSWP